MTKVNKEITRNQLESIAEDYHSAFPSWRVLERTLIARESGPIMQGIGFQCLSTGRYRPISSIYYLCIPDRQGGSGVQFLKHPVQDIDPSSHERLRNQVVKAIHEQIVPSVSAALDPEQVLAMNEGREVIRSPDAHHLAALSAYLGQDERALYWCRRFPDLVNERGLGWQESDRRREEFLQTLTKWVEKGDARQQLDSVVQIERRHWGLL